MSSYSAAREAGIAHLIENDPLLGEYIQSAPRPTFEPHENYFLSLVSSIISQQLSVKAAATIKKRVFALFPNDTPTPELLLETQTKTLREAGLSERKVLYIYDLSERVLDGRVHFKDIDGMQSDKITEMLTQVKGVGVWTSHMFLMFTLGRFDVLPVGDLGIKNAIHAYYNLPTKPDEATVLEISTLNKWHPYESIASWYLWRTLDNEPDLE